MIGKHLNKLPLKCSHGKFLRITSTSLSTPARNQKKFPKRTSRKVQYKIQMKLIVYESPDKVGKRTKLSKKYLPYNS